MEPQQLDNGALRGHRAITHREANGGYITLLATLIVSILGVAVAFSALLIGGDTADVILKLEQSFEAHAYADACAESGLLALTGEESFSGSDSMTFSAGDCDYTVETVSATESVLESSGSSGSVIRKVKVTATVEHTVTEMGTTTSIIDAVWQEPADF
jgi:hypothetical protein